MNQRLFPHLSEPPLFESGKMPFPHPTDCSPLLVFIGKLGLGGGKNMPGDSISVIKFKKSL